MVELEEVEEYLVQNDEPVATSTEVADALGCSRRHALDSLKLLKRSGDVESKEIGARATAWWHVDRVTPPRVAPVDHPDQTDLEEAQRDAVESARKQASENAEHLVRQIEDDDPLAAVQFPSGKDREACVDAVRAAEAFLREHERATMRDFVAEVLPEHPVGYPVVELGEGERYRGSWWRRVIKPGLKALPTVGDAGADGEWRWAGE